MSEADVIIIGSGMGGATLAAGLAPSGLRILILERGERIKPSCEARDDKAIFRDGHFRPDEFWFDGKGKPFKPGNYYCVGGNSKFYGAVLMRYRECDFSPINHFGGRTMGWPIRYQELEPFYQQAEQIYQVRGEPHVDTSEPPHSGDYNHPAVPDEPVIADLRTRLTQVGLTPVSLPLGVDLGKWLEGGQTPWDAFPDTCGGKMDAESAGLASALKHPNVSIRTSAKVQQLLSNADGHIVGVRTRFGANSMETLQAPIVVLAAGAVQSAALLLRSANDGNPKGIANSSDQVGRNFMNHNASVVMALHPLRRNPSVYQKTLMMNDFYETGGPDGQPLGNIQLVGKVSGEMVAASTPLPRFVANTLASRSVDFYAMSEDLPDPESRVIVNGDAITLKWKRTNFQAQRHLVSRLRTKLRKAGFPIVLAKNMDPRTPSHQCGTARMGTDPKASVVDGFGRAHDHPNLYITDASTLPTSAAVNPALTVAANALRTAKRIQEVGLAA